MPSKPARDKNEKTSRKDIKKLRDFIDRYKYFFIIGHTRPDGDCVGSQIALSGLLRRLGKKAFLLSSGPFSDNVAQTYRSMFYDSYSSIEGAPPLDTSDVAVLCVDTSSLDHLGPAYDELKSLPTAIIDHHSEGAIYGSVRYVDSLAPSNTLLIHRLFEEYSILPTREDAHCILLGLLTDTQFFRFVRAKDTEIFDTASKMVQRGVSPEEIYNQIGHGCTFLSRKVIAKVLSRAIRVNNNRVIISYLCHKDYLYKDDIPQSHEVYQMLQGVQKTEVVVYIQEDTDDYENNVCKVGMRSHEKVDVAKIARDFGGGGHKKASGFSIEEPLQHVYEKLKRYFDALQIEKESPIGTQKKENIPTVHDGKKNTKRRK